MQNSVLGALIQLIIRSCRAEGITYGCRGRGAILSLPHGGFRLRQDVIQTNLFRKYIGDNVGTWFKWSKDKGLPIERLEDLVFVYGCTLVTWWAAATFDDHAADAQVSLASRTLENREAIFVWNNIRGMVEYHDSQLDTVRIFLATYTLRLSTYLFCFTKRIIHTHLRIDASSSSASERSASFA